MTSTHKSILMLGCFDTKGEVLSFLRERLLAQGEQVLAVSTGVMGTTAYIPVDIVADELINDRAFSETAVQVLLDLIKKTKVEKQR
ncbi:Tm-1-like ATP-binding domain-containing protein [Pontibacter russatus]|uniref:Tm-1-like ATP-binding domain-containing protein n=1 Tax=Pontibacter russatus TaxID=2694929 RepID=UPI00137B7D1D|nr:Tm-1-like ATP-binding domain-containing protein [Pontibacter russatus]